MSNLDKEKGKEGTQMSSLIEERALMEELAKKLRDRFPETTDRWSSAPASYNLMSAQTGQDQSEQLWGKYGEGKLCQHDVNARSDLRRRQNDL